MKKRLHVWIYGKVKNVFFRAGIKEKADELGVKGFVRNNEDNVEAVFEADKEKIEEMIQFCKTGPKYSQVERIKEKEETYDAAFKDFRILYF